MLFPKTKIFKWNNKWNNKWNKPAWNILNKSGVKIQSSQLDRLYIQKADQSKNY